MSEPKVALEVREGTDFFDWQEPVGLIAGNFPWSHTEYSRFAAHAFEVADVVISLTKLTTALGTDARIDAWRSHGHGLREVIRIRWEDAEFQFLDESEKSPEGYALCAAIWVRGHEGAVYLNHNWYDNGIPDKPEPIQKKKTGRLFHVVNIASDNVECYTPPNIFEALDCRFDLDPASPGKDVVPWIPADRCYTRADDGLVQLWEGFVWLNNPYGRDIMPKWTKKFADHGNGVILAKDATTTNWYKELISRADLVLALHQKISFIRPGKKSKSYSIGHHLIAIGQKGVQALHNAYRAGLGYLVYPNQPMSIAVE
jgi:hypothetical protein